jgi:hypothetical protein
MSGSGSASGSRPDMSGSSSASGSRPDMSGGHTDLVESALASADVPWERGDGAEWTVTLAGENKRTIPVHLRLEDQALHLRSLLCRSPDEGHEEVYRYLLARNERSGAAHFALDGDGNIVLVGSLPREALDRESFERLLGAVLTLADEVYNAVLRRGFASYIDVEQRWRAARGMPPNPVSSPD